MVSQSPATLLNEHVNLTLKCIDRVYLNVYQPMLQNGGGIAYYFRHVKHYPVPSSVLMANMTKAFKAAVDDYISNHDIEVVRFKKGQRKDDITKQRLANHDGTEGVLYVGIAQEKARVFRTISKINTDTGKSYPWLMDTTVMCNHYYFYIYDKDFGPLFIKICSYFPYTIRVCLNGHEYLKQQLQQNGIDHEPLDNGIYSCENHDAMQKIANQLDAEKMEKVIEKWLLLLPSAFTQEDRKNGIRYEVSIIQAEFAETQVFDKPIIGRYFFEQVIKDNLDLGRPEQISLIFNRRVTKRTPGTFRTRVITHDVIPSLQVNYKSSKIKQYFKESKALRTETVVNNPRDFYIGKKIVNLNALRELAFESNERLLHLERATQDCFTAREVFKKIHHPVVQNNQRVSGLRFGDDRVMALFQILCYFFLSSSGFTNRELREKVACMLGKNPGEYSQNMMTYDLRRLRLHHIIEKVENQNRYKVTQDGLKVCLFLTKVHTKLFNGSISQLISKSTDAVNSKLGAAFKTVDNAMNEEINGLKLAA